VSEGPHDHDRSDDTRIRDVIRLAIENEDRVRSPLDGDQLRRVAESMGAGSRVLDKLNAAQDEEAAERSRLKRLRRVQRLLLGATSLGLAWTARFIENVFLPDSSLSLLPEAIAPLAGLALFLAVYNRLRGDQRTYQLDNTAIWTGFTLGWSVLPPQSFGDILPGAACWVAFSVLGIVVARRGRATPPDEASGEALSQRVKILRRSSEREEPVERRGSPRALSPVSAAVFNVRDRRECRE
jgi:hypothetical protein